MRRLLFACVLVAGCSSGNGRGGDGGTNGDGGNCPGGDTTVVGTVFAPNGQDPVPNATVYVPVGEPQPYSDGIACDLCGMPAGASTSTVTRYDGGFTLPRVPSGPVKLVIELGRFRRVVPMNITACQPNLVPKDPGVFGVRLPGKDGDLSAGDHVPRIAVATGDFDQIECVLSRMGISQIDLYDDRYGGTLPSTVGDFFALLNDPAKLEKYNLVIVNCTNNGFEAKLTPQVLANLEHYVRNGGRLYATDWAYDFINQVPEFAPYMCYVAGGVDGASPPLTCPGTPQTKGEAHSNTPWDSAATVHDQTMASWLGVFPNTIINGQVPVQFNFVVVNHVGDAAHPTTVWLDGDAMDPNALPQLGKGTRPMTVTFDYQQCGRVHYSTYNTEPAAAPNDNAVYRYPMCNNRTTFNPQERLLEYLIFETAQCVGPIG